MLDTVWINIEDCKIKSKYKPNTNLINKHGESITKNYLNTKDYSVIKNSYGIHIETRKKESIEIVKVQLSIAKYLYGSNLFEVTLDERTYQEFIDKLFRELNCYLDNITREKLENAYINRIDFCKNIIFDEQMLNVNTFVERVSHLDLTSQFNLTEREYKNNKRLGKSSAFYNGLQALCFYSKEEEILNKTENQSTQTEISLQKLFKENEIRQILRIERRLQKLQALKSIITKFKNLQRYRLKDIWDSDLCKKILKEIITDTQEQNFNIFAYRQYPKDSELIRKLLYVMKAGQVARMFMIKKLTDELGAKEAYQLYKDCIPERTFNYNLSQYKAATKHMNSFKYSEIGEIWKYIIDAIDNSELLSSRNWKEIMIIKPLL